MSIILKAKNIRPEGWLRRQLEIEAAGLSGNLDRIWPDVRDSAWIGGDRDGWERVPYWLDGFIPLAFYLEDEGMIERATRYINGILETQKPDGWLCPGDDDKRLDYDLWAYLLICKVLALWCDFTDDARAEDALLRGMERLYLSLEDGSARLGGWGQFRWFEGLIPILYLNERHDAPFLLPLARILKERGTHYPDLTHYWQAPADDWRLYWHIVNLAMMPKYEALTSALFGEEYTGEAEALLDLLYEKHGTAVGTVNGDECLGGPDNNHGTELCGVVEFMYTCETLHRLTGDDKWADRVEEMAFNALPATMSEDMWTHQYDQLVNQVACTTLPQRGHFTTNGPEAHLFGLEPEYGCCTANMAQGWPKFVMTLFRAEDDGVLSTSMVPASVTFTAGDVTVKLSQKSLYPFRDCCTYTVDCDGTAEFPLWVRIPAWAEGVTVNGTSAIVDGTRLLLGTSFCGKTEFTVTLGASANLLPRKNGLYFVKRGALVYSLPVDSEKTFLRDEEAGQPWALYELRPTSDWAFGFTDDALTYGESEMGEVPFSEKNSPVYIDATLAPVEWKCLESFPDIACPTPISDKAVGTPRTMRLIPYGCTMLRMTEMPKTK